MSPLLRAVHVTFVHFVHLSISCWNASWYKMVIFFSQDGKMEHKLSDIFYNSHQMFRSKQIILNNQGLCKTRHHVHEYGWSSRHPRFKISEAQTHTLPAGHFCQQRTFALWLCIRSENREPPKPFGLPLATTDPPPHPHSPTCIPPGCDIKQGR